MFSSCGDGEVDVRRDGVPFQFVHANVNIKDEGKEVIDLDVPRFG